ncbi:uncharacterized protein K452DRAFT_80868 [Aplosporella prunicola CBS 121167]|uniref:Uncharacterized protein n=1 Tax=Aplosporella prunicola CBS 121167 TaxID=1176127 RepID=A0A6A6B4M2_9PEZI|nr:uncharacterized protein K452DRAFT_80868 [Aplosporella prunicola CBS 121167]KAF2139102.1 hypothetical protein K452DRAFT_80868 [Aplosporella prunicola CBS 121167]
MQSVYSERASRGSIRGRYRQRSRAEGTGAWGLGSRCRRWQRSAILWSRSTPAPIPSSNCQRKGWRDVIHGMPEATVNAVRRCHARKSQGTFFPSATSPAARRRRRRRRRHGTADFRGSTSSRVPTLSSDGSMAQTTVAFPPRACAFARELDRSPC